MAKPLQLGKLKAGVEAWNKWRKDNPEIRRECQISALVDRGARLHAGIIQRML